jgi:hypothetical protein
MPWLTFTIQHFRKKDLRVWFPSLSFFFYLLLFRFNRDHLHAVHFEMCFIFFAMRSDFSLTHVSSVPSRDPEVRRRKSRCLPPDKLSTCMVVFTRNNVIIPYKCSKLSVIHTDSNPCHSTRNQLPWTTVFSDKDEPKIYVGTFVFFLSSSINTRYSPQFRLLKLPSTSFIICYLLICEVLP